MDGPDKFAALQAIGLNGVTLDGVQGKFKGDLRGGYLRGDQSILTLYEQMMAAESDLERAKEESAEAEARLESASRNRGRLTKEAQSGRTRLERAEAALAAARARRGAAERDRAALHGRLRDAEDEAHRRRCDIKEAEGDLAALAAVVQGDTLLATQERTDLEAAVKALRRRHRAAFKDMNAKEAEACRLRNLLQECLLKRREDAEEALSALGGSELEARASNTKEEMEDAKYRTNIIVRLGAISQFSICTYVFRQLFATLQVEMASADTALTAAVKERRRSDKHEDTLVQAAEEAQSRHAEVAAALARKESRLASLRADVEGGAGGAGTVPHEEVERMQDWEDKRLFGRKKKLSKVLKKFKGVNSLATEEMRRQEEAKAKYGSYSSLLVLQFSHVSFGPSDFPTAGRRPFRTTRLSATCLSTSRPSASPRSTLPTARSTSTSRRYSGTWFRTGRQGWYSSATRGTPPRPPPPRPPGTQGARRNRYFLSLLFICISSRRE